MTKIVVSYRRADSAAIAGRIFDRLVHRYGEEAVFMDVDHIPIGTDFRLHIQGVLETCDAFVAVVGLRWAGDGHERIKEDADPVRVEVETALQRGVPIIPVLVDGARMPTAAQLPDSLQAFAYINAAEVETGRDFRQHMERLTRTLDSILTQRGKAVPPPPPPTQFATAPGAAAPARSRAPLWGALALVLMLAGAGGFAWWNGWLTRAAPLQLTSNGTEPSTPAGSPAAVPADPPAAPAPPQATPAAPPAPAPVAEPRPAPAAAPAAPLPAAPAAPPPATYRVLSNVSTGVQNMRSGPATKYPIVVAIPAGSTGIKLNGCRASEDGTRPWCSANWRTFAGWISSCCIVDERTGAPPRVD